MTLSRYLKQLQREKNITHDHLKRTYKITRKGTTLLNELDTETRGTLFIDNLISDTIKPIFDVFSEHEDFKNLDPFSNKAFYEVLEKRIGKAIIFLSLKVMNPTESVMNPVMSPVQFQPPEVLKQLSHLPFILSIFFEGYKATPDKIKSFYALDDSKFIDGLESRYQDIMNKLTPEDYKRTVEIQKKELKSDIKRLFKEVEKKDIKELEMEYWKTQV